MKNNDELRESLAGIGLDEMDDIAMFEAPSYASAFIGVDIQTKRLVYSFEKMVEHLMEEDNMTCEDAVDFIEFNTIRSLPYINNAPIIMYEYQGG